MGNEHVVYVFTLLFSCKNEILPFWTNMDRTRRYYANSSKLNTEKQIPYDLAYIWKLTQNQTKIDELQETENRLAVARGRWWAGGVNG